ncbi:MAG TPA: AlkA N-terminal domain-containing protein [Candidatus Dormibacteraeota bacterium]|jgi:AraC family transcriptional regulator of adaptative response / DNA-3-methyladenine glycosylase II
MHDDFDACYRAILSRDARFDGRFFTAVTSTGIYCRPICPAQTPKRANVRFYPSAAAAQAAGFRACLRCRPDLAPGPVQTPAGDRVVDRALRLIAAGAADGGAGVAALARRLEVSERHLHRVLSAAVGAGPSTLARMRRLQTARTLIEQTAMPITDVAFSAGYSSLRQFNSEIRAGTGRPPTELRRRGSAGHDGEGAITLRLGVRPPFDGCALLAFFAQRAVASVERCSSVSLTRSLSLPNAAAVVELEPQPAQLLVRLWLDDVRDLGAAVDACRRLFDVDADPQAIAAVLGADALLAPLVCARPGLRVPGCVDGVEIAIRAVLGQQVSVARATALASRLTEHVGAPLPRPRHGVERIFPTAAAVANADLGGLGLTGERAATLRRLTVAIANGDIDLTPGADAPETVRRLLSIRGIGAWTATYVAMRGLRDPDAFPAGDLGLRRAVAQAGGENGAALLSRAERWRPWRAYATVHLWNQLSHPAHTMERAS